MPDDSHSAGTYAGSAGSRGTARSATPVFERSATARAQARRRGGMARHPAFERFLAVAIPLAVVTNRLYLRPGVFYNDFLMPVVACVVFMTYGSRLLTRSALILCALFAFVSAHCILMYLLHPEQASTLINSMARVGVVIAAGVAFVSFYEQADLSSAIDGVRRAALIFAVAIFVHFVLLNLMGDVGVRLATMQQSELDSRGAALTGYFRPFGLTAEPAYASAYMFLMAAFVWLARPGKHIVDHCIYLFAALLAGSSGLLLSLPVWVLILLSRRRMRTIVAWGFVFLCAFGASLRFGDALQPFFKRTGLIAEGNDLSANTRFIPAMRTIAGTWKDSPWIGYGIDEARLADAAGRAYVGFTGFNYREPDRFSGVLTAEIIGDFGFPALLVFGMLLWYGAMQARWSKASFFWALSMFVTQQCYFSAGYRYAQLYYWCALGILLRRPTARGARRWVRTVAQRGPRGGWGGLLTRRRLIRPDGAALF